MDSSEDVFKNVNSEFFGWNFYKKYKEDKTYARPTQEDIMCEVQLNSLSTHETLKPYTSNNKFLEQIEPYADKWVPYLHRPGFVNDRQGLMLSGLKGDSYDDSLSIPEARRRTGNPDLKESEFSYPTQLYKDLSCLHKVCDYFSPLGRTYIVKANKGSFFPPHRDYPLISRDNFRIVSFFGDTRSYSWETAGQKLQINPGKFYYVDTRKPHQTHMWGEEPSYHLIMNIPKTWDNVVKLMSIISK